MEYNPKLNRVFGLACRKVIPLVFDQSYSYYESICSFVNKLNEIVDMVNLQNMSISEFENRMNQLFATFKTEIQLAFADYQIEMNQKYEDFTTEIETAWNEYKTALNAEWQEERLINHNFRIDITTAWNTYQSTINGAISSMQSDISNFESNITTQQTTFENTITQQQTDFETAQTARQTTFETTMTNRATTFENNITQQQTDFENDVEQQLRDYASIDYESYFGSYSPIQVDPPTINSIGANPLDTSDMIIRLYYKGASDTDISFIGRFRYMDLMQNYATWAAAWSSASQCFWAIFENPAVWEWFRNGITPIAQAAANYSTDQPRLAVYCFDDITNDKVKLSEGTNLATYTLPRSIIDIPNPMTTVTENYSGAKGKYQYLGLGFYAGLTPGSIQTVTPPANAKTSVYPGYVYSAFNGGIVRDPELINLMNEPKLFTTGTSIQANSDLDDFNTAGKFFCSSSSTVSGLSNKPTGLTTAFTMLVIPTTAANRFIQLIIDNSNTGSIYFRKYTTNGYSSWYQFTVSTVT